MRVVVTGGAGFIGANLVRAALADPTVTDLCVIDDMSTGSAEVIKKLDVEFVEASVLDREAIGRAMAGRDAVVHLAALPSVPRSVRDPVASHTANASGTLAVLEAARHGGVEHVIVASSSSVYGANPTLPKQELTWTRPLSPYAASKLATEAYALAYQASYGLASLVFRFFNVYGPGQRHDHPYAAAIPRFLYAALREEPVIIHGDGRQTRDFTYVDTVCAVLLDAMRRRMHHPDPVNLAFGCRTDLLAVIDELEQILGHPIPRRHSPARPGDVRHSEADGGLLRTLFPGIAPTPLADGLRATAAWLAEQLPAAGGSDPASPVPQTRTDH